MNASKCAVTASVVVVGMVTIALLASACAPAATPTPEVVKETVVVEVTPHPEPTPTRVTGAIRGGTITIAVGEDFGGLDSATVASISGVWLNSLTRSGLVKVDLHGQLVPELAESWEHDEQGTTWVFHLRKGVMFHTGREVVADDVVYSMNRLMDPDVGSPAKADLESVTRVGRDDDYTVVFELSVPNLDFPYVLQAHYFKILPSDQPVEDHNKNPIGTGPFILEELVPGERAVLRRNESYFREGLPYLDEVVMLVMPETATQIAGLQSGTIDIAQEIGFDNYQLLEADPRLVAAPSAGVIQHLIYMDVTQPPFDDVRVRDAMRYLVDRQGLLDAAYYGQGQASCDTPLPPGNPYRVEDVGICKRDIDKAKQLLADAGYADGIHLELWTLSDRPGFLGVALAFQEQAKDANVNIEVRTVPGGLFWAEKWLTVAMGVSNWGWLPTADTRMRSEFTCGAPWNETKFCNKEFDRLLDEALTESNEARRLELYTRAQEILATEGGMIIPFYYPRLAAHRYNVMNFNADIQNAHDLSEVWLAPEE